MICNSSKYVKSSWVICVQTERQTDIIVVSVVNRTCMNKVYGIWLKFQKKETDACNRSIGSLEWMDVLIIMKTTCVVRWDGRATAALICPTMCVSLCMCVCVTSCLSGNLFYLKYTFIVVEIFIKLTSFLVKFIIGWINFEFCCCSSFRSFFYFSLNLSNLSFSFLPSFYGLFWILSLKKNFCLFLWHKNIWTEIYFLYMIDYLFYLIIIWISKRKREEKNNAFGIDRWPWK